MMYAQTTTPSRHFTIRELAEGVYAAVAINGGAAISNSGIIDLGNLSLIYDTFLTPQAAKDLLAAAHEITGRDPEIIINSHYHNDHIWGNQVFSPAAKVISTTQTRHLIQTEGKVELEWALGNSAKRLEEFSKQYAEAKSDQDRKESLLWMGYYKGMVEDLTDITVRLPDITFDKRMTIHGQSRTLDLIPFKEAHTGNDAILYLREDHIVFMADLLFVGCHPYLAECDAFKLLEALKEIENMDASIFVPGHGTIGSKNDLTLMIDYITMCLDRSKSLVAQGAATEENIGKEKLPEKYSSWELSGFFHINIQAMCRQFSGK
jgi:glyoxylase-like metal-dependent hydrolase (beta-lactamase superfamily II)